MPQGGHPPHHSITSSAVVSSKGGTVTPSASAVLRFMARLNLVGCSIGNSPGFAPRRILSTKSAARLNSASPRLHSTCGCHQSSGDCHVNVTLPVLELLPRSASPYHPYDQSILSPL